MIDAHMGAVAVKSDSGDRPRVRQPRRQGLRLTILALLILSLIATGVSVASFFVPGAVVSALVAAFFYGLLVAVRFVERRVAAARRVEDAGAGDWTPVEPQELEELEEGAEVAPDVSEEVVVAERAGLRTALIIAAPLVVLALVLAAVFVGWRIVGLGALAFFAIMIFMGAPVWLAAVEDEIDEEEERIGVDMRSIR